MKNNKKGFTLIELLITIGVLAVLATVVVLVLNPAELFRQARDTQRLSDLSAVRDAIIFTLATDDTAPTVGTTAQTSGGVVPATQCNAGVNAIFGTTCALTVPAASTDNDGTGWAAVDLTGATGGAPLASLPLDPSYTPTEAIHFYAFKGTAGGTFKLGTVLESTKFRTTQDLDGSDGGTATEMYEIGTVMTAI